MAERTPTALVARVADLQGRIDRTLDYLREVATAADTEIVARVVLATIKSLDTPTQGASDV